MILFIAIKPIPIIQDNSFLKELENDLKSKCLTESKCFKKTTWALNIKILVMLPYVVTNKISLKLKKVGSFVFGLTVWFESILQSSMLHDLCKLK